MSKKYGNLMDAVRGFHGKEIREEELLGMIADKNMKNVDGSGELPLLGVLELGDYPGVVGALVTRTRNSAFPHIYDKTFARAVAEACDRGRWESAKALVSDPEIPIANKYYEGGEHPIVRISSKGPRDLFDAMLARKDWEIDGELGRTVVGALKSRGDADMLKAFKIELVRRTVAGFSDGMTPEQDKALDTFQRTFFTRTAGRDPLESSSYSSASR